MNGDTNDKIRDLSNAELVELVKAGAECSSPEEIALARDELSRRGFSLDGTDASEARVEEGNFSSQASGTSTHQFSFTNVAVILGGLAGLVVGALFFELWQGLGHGENGGMGGFLLILTLVFMLLGVAIGLLLGAPIDGALARRLPGSASREEESENESNRPYLIRLRSSSWFWAGVLLHFLFLMYMFKPPLPYLEKNLSFHFISWVASLTAGFVSYAVAIWKARKRG